MYTQKANRHIHFVCVLLVTDTSQLTCWGILLLDINGVESQQGKLHHCQCERVGDEDGEGVADVDMILYVSAKNVDLCGSGSGSPLAIAFASSCQMEGALDR